jgi:hypothetical protein
MNLKGLFGKNQSGCNDCAAVKLLSTKMKMELQELQKLLLKYRK